MFNLNEVRQELFSNESEKKYVVSMMHLNIIGQFVHGTHFHHISSALILAVLAGECRIGILFCVSLYRVKYTKLQEITENMFHHT